MAETRTFNDVNRAHFEAIKKSVKNSTAIVIASDAGSASGNGVSLSWEYQEPEATLSVTVEKTPFLVSAGYVLGRVAALVSETA